MKFIVLRDNLKDSLTAVERSVAEQNNLPILKNILLATHEKAIRVAATNLEMAVTCLTPGKVQEEGGITVPFGVFANIVAHSDSDRIHLETEQNTLRVYAENYTTKLQGLPAEEFPIIPYIKASDRVIELAAEAAQQAFADVLPAAQASEIRPEISGVLFEFQVNAVKLVATDSFRLAERTLTASQFSTTIPRGFRAIIPLKAAQEIVRVFPKRAALRFAFDPNQLGVSGDERMLITRLIDGQYPEYEQIIPKEHACEATVPRAPLEHALRLVGGFSGKTNEVRMRLSEDKNSLELYSASQYVGEGTYRVPVKVRGGAVPEAMFNARYLADGLKPIMGESLAIGLNGDARPAVLRAPGDASYLYLVMPIKRA